MRSSKTRFGCVLCAFAPCLHGDTVFPDISPTLRGVLRGSFQCVIKQKKCVLTLHTCHTQKDAQEFQDGDDSEDTNARTAGVSWRTDTACAYELEQAAVEMEKRGEEANALGTAAAASAKEKIANQERAGLKTLEQVIMLWRAAGCVQHERVLGDADKYGFASRVWQGEDPNADPFEPAEIADPNCDDLHELPGMQILSSGCVNLVCSFAPASVGASVLWECLRGEFCIVTLSFLIRLRPSRPSSLQFRRLSDQEALRLHLQPRMPDCDHLRGNI